MKGGGLLAAAAPTIPGWWNKQPVFGKKVTPLERDILWAANSVLPYMMSRDQAEIGRYLYIATGGAAGPFAQYLTANENPFSGTDVMGTRAAYEALKTNLGNIKDENLRAAAQNMVDLALDTLPAPGQARTRNQEIALQDGLRRQLQGGVEGWDILGAVLSKVFKPTKERPEPGELVWSSDLNMYIPVVNPEWV